LAFFGVRFDDRVTGQSGRKFCEHGTIVHIDIEPFRATTKNKLVQLPIVSDIKIRPGPLERDDQETPDSKRVRFLATNKSPSGRRKGPLRYQVTGRSDEVATT